MKKLSIDHYKSHISYFVCMQWTLISTAFLKGFNPSGPVPAFASCSSSSSSELSRATGVRHEITKLKIC